MLNWNFNILWHALSGCVSNQIFQECNRMYDNLWNNNHYENLYTLVHLHDTSVGKLLLYNQSQGFIGKNKCLNKPILCLYLAMNLPAHIFLPLHLEVRYSNWEDETKVCKPDLASCSRGHFRFVFIHILTIN